jgi:hypothetical protein
MIMLLGLLGQGLSPPCQGFGGFHVIIQYHQLVRLAGVAPAYSCFISSVKSFVFSVGKISFMHCLHIIHVSVRQGVLCPFPSLAQSLAPSTGRQIWSEVWHSSSCNKLRTVLLTALDLVVVAGSTISA